MSGDKMVKDGEEGMFISNFWLDQATNSFNLVKSMLEERIDTIKSLKNKLEGRDTRVLELLTEVVELRYTLDTKDTIILDLKKAIEEQANALRDMSKVIKERDVTIRSLHLSLGEAYERDTDNYCNPE